MSDRYDAPPPGWRLHELGNMYKPYQCVREDVTGMHGTERGAHADAWELHEAEQAAVARLRAEVERLRAELFDSRRTQEAAEKHARWSDLLRSRLRYEVERALRRLPTISGSQGVHDCRSILDDALTREDGEG